MIACSHSPRAGELSGPWDQAFWFTVPGPWASKSNFRRNRRGGRNAWQVAASFQQQVTLLARIALPEGWELGPPPPAPVSQRPAIVAFIYADSLLDVPNLDKSALDGLERVVFHTDAVVRASLCMGSRNRGDGTISIARIPPTSGHATILSAMQELAVQTLVAFGEEGLAR